MTFSSSGNVASIDQPSSVDNSSLAVDDTDATLIDTPTNAPPIDSNSVSSIVEKEALDNVQRIRTDIPLWRQKSGEYCHYIEEERHEAELKLWRYVAIGAVMAGVIAMMMWKRYGKQS